MSVETVITGKRAKSKAANRSAILKAGRRVFARIGYEATTVRDIIRETDLAAGTFYNYFKSKEAVFAAIAEDSTLQFGEILKEVRQSASSVEDYIHSAYLAYFTFCASENEVAIAEGAPHMALIGVRVDTPEMLAIAHEIKADLEINLEKTGVVGLDTDFLSAAAIGVAREMGDHMLKRRPVDPKAAARFASGMLLAGIQALSSDET